MEIDYPLTVAAPDRASGLDRHFRVTFDSRFQDVHVSTYKGVSFPEAPRGTLSHWAVIETDDKTMKLANYQAAVPST